MRSGKINRMRDSAQVANGKKRKATDAAWVDYRAGNPVNYHSVKVAQTAAEKELGYDIRMTRATDFDQDGTASTGGHEGVVTE